MEFNSGFKGLKIEGHVGTAFEVTLCFKYFYYEYHPKSCKNNNKKFNFFLNYVFPIKQLFLNDFFFFTLKMFSIAKIIFFIIQSAKKK